MRTTALIFAVVASSALMGCGAMQVQMVPLTAFKCTKTVDCAVTVHVTNCVVSVDDDRKAIEMKARDLLIRWELDEAAIEAKYRFDPDKGIALKASDPDDQFYEKGPHGNAMQYHFRDRNTNYRTYDYEINIVQKGTGVKCRLDPQIINN